MGEWNIYHKDGTPLTDANGKTIIIKELEYNGEWMGACNLSVEIKNEAPVVFSIGDYIDYRDERFEINYDPGKIKSAPRNESGDGFKYSGVVFNSYIDELVRSEFLDIILNDNKIHYTALPKFVFYVSSLDDIADRLQANMNEIYGEGSWHFYTRNRGKSVTDRGCDAAMWANVYGEEKDVVDNVIESTSLSVSSQTCWDVLGLVNSQFDVNFIVRGRNVFIGTTGFTAEHIFKYGKGNGLYEIEETSDSSQSVITRMRAYGNTTNMPTRYYAEVGARCMANVESMDSYVPSDHGIAGCALELDLEFSINEFTERRISKPHDQQSNTYVSNDEALAIITLDDITTVTGSIRKSLNDSKKSKISIEYSDDAFMEDGTLCDNTYNKSREDVVKFINAVKVGSVLYFTNAKRSKFPSKNIAYTSDLPNNMAIDRLMLPGFPNESLQTWWNRQSTETKARLNPTGADLRFSTDQYRPYVESPNIDKIGIRPASVFFDTDDEKNGLKDIYPTIEEMMVDNKRIDEIDTGSKDVVTDNGVYKDGQTVPNFDIYLKKEIDFDIKTLANDDFQINMKDGMCGGRSFKVAATTKTEDGRWKLRLERSLDSDLNLYFPYNDFPINTGDHFVLTGLDMPESYVSHNSETLLKYCIAKLLDNDYTRKTYTPKVDEIFMARQNDEAEADETGATKSIYKTIKEGDLIQIKDNDLGIDRMVTIEKLSIKEKDGKLPTYDITLKEEKDVGTIQKIQNQISSIVSGATGAGGYTNSQIEGMVVSAGKEHFLSKTGNDTARGLIKFLKGISLGTNYSISELGDAFLRVIQGKGYYISEDGDVVFREIASSDYDYAAQSGYGMKRREDGKFKLSLTDLEVWGKAVFHELEIRKLSYVGGNFIFSPAGSTLMHVEEIKTSVLQGQASIITGYKCYFLADDGTTATENMWKVGDLAFSQSFGIKEGVYENVGNRRYWRKVTAVSSESEQITDADGNILYDGRKFGWITLSNTMAGTSYDKNSDAPRAGDAVCCLGNVSDEERQNAIEIQTVGDLAPAIIQYGGIKTFSLTNCVKTQISPKGNKFIGDFSTTTGTDIGGAITDINSNLSDTNGRITNLNDYTTNAVKKIEGEIDEVRTAAEDAGADAQDALEGVTQVKGSVTTLQTDVNGITGTVAKLSEKVDENGNQIEALETSVSEIKQTADSISLKVDQQSVRGRNLIPRSYFFNTSRIYGIGQRKFTLEAGKYYSLSVNGHIDAALKNGGGVLRAFIFNFEWTFAVNLDIDSTTDITATLTFKLEGNGSFTPPSTGEYYFQAYPFHPTGKFKDTKPQEDGLITLNWAQLEEGSVCSPWSLHESDPAISGNFLPVLSDSKWSRVGDIQEGALDTGFRKLQALHYKNTSSSEVDVLYMNNIFAPDSGEVYTLSFWAKGSGTFKSFLYPEACERVADNFGQVGTGEDGYLPHTLTSDWQRIRIAYCIKQLFGNYFYNAGFNAASGYTSNWDVTGSTSLQSYTIDGWNAIRVSKSSGASYCEISQAVGASLWASWWTVTFKSKSPSVMRIYLSGISLDTIDNSGMTVCVDGVDQSVKNDGSVNYVEISANTSAYTEHSVTFKATSALSSARIYFRTYGSYFFITKPMLTPSSQKSGFSTREQGTVRSILPCRLAAGSEVWIGGVKLEQGGRMTDYTEDGVSVDELLATGIDIRSRKITATADTFEVRNNQGTTTAKVNADGVFETNDIVCNGGTFKNIKSTDMTAEGGTFTNITAESGTYKNIQVTENSWISNGKFCGEKQSDGTILGGFSVGSQGLTYDIPQGWLGSSKGAASNITIQGADGSLSSKIGVIFDNNYLMGAELKVKYSKNDTPWGSYNVAAWLEASGNPQGQNYAFMGTGHGILRGMIEGTSFALISSSKLEIGTVDLQFYGNRWLFDCPLGVVNVYLPARGGVATFLGNSGAWSLRIMVICSPTSSNSVKISGRQSSGTWASTEEPILYNKSGSQVSSITVNKGQIMEILLVWDGTNYYAMHIKDNG